MATALRSDPSFDWRLQLGVRLVSPEDAVAHIESGDRVSMSLSAATPFTLCTVLAGRLMELDDVVINHTAALFNWDLPGLGERFRVNSSFVTPVDRPLLARGAVDFVPVQYYREGHLPHDLEGYNVFMVTVSRPDERGYVNFGPLQIMSKMLARNAALVIAEIDTKWIRVSGDNSLHISEIDWFVERPKPLEPGTSIVPPTSPEEQQNIKTVSEILARELIPDRVSLQVGVGSMSGAIMPALRNHHDLGIQTEIVPAGTATLMREGVITGKYKKIFPELVVGSGMVLLTEDELRYVDGNPAFQLYDFNTTDDVRLIAREEGLFAINNALAVDLTGQANSESIGSQMYTGSGGQLAFMVGACLGGGTTILVTPSTSMVQGQRRSRIVPALLEGGVVTTPRGCVHHVVTEYGVATLKGKSIRERAHELIAVAHPDFRGELRSEAKRLYSV